MGYPYSDCLSISAKNKWNEQQHVNEKENHPVDLVFLLCDPLGDRFPHLHLFFGVVSITPGGAVYSKS